MRVWIRIGVVALAFGAAPAVHSMFRGDHPTSFQWGVLALIAVTSSALISAGLSGVTLEIDGKGISWRQPFFHRTFLWRDIEGFGVATVRVQDPTENPIARTLLGGRRMYSMIEPMLGVNLKLGNRNPATVAYQRGFVGYDYAIPVSGEAGFQALADDLERRRLAAVSRLSI